MTPRHVFLIQLFTNGQIASALVLWADGWKYSSATMEKVGLITFILNAVALLILGIVEKRRSGAI